MSNDMFEDFSWQVSIGIDSVINSNKKFYSRMANTKKALNMFIAVNEKVLVHKSSKALWKISEDGKFIEPVFDGNIIPAEDEEY